MRRAHFLLSLICTSSIALFGCSFDQGGFDYGGDAGTGPDADHSCISNSECASPPDACHIAGTCNEGQCEYQSVDCSSLDSPCSVGLCDLPTGDCVAEPANEGNVCHDPSVGEWSECEFGGTCGLTGQRVRSRSDWTCSAGSCDADTVDEQGTCQRDPNDVVGMPCGDVECTPGDCYSNSQDTCSEEGWRTVFCSGATCGWQGGCQQDNWTYQEQCSIDTDGHQCWSCGDGWPGGPPPSCKCDDGECDETDTNTGGG